MTGSEDGGFTIPDNWLSGGEQFISEAIDFMTWSRRLWKEADTFQVANGLHRPSGVPVSIEEVESVPMYQPIDKRIALTFCGHSMIRRPMLWRSHYFLDTGAGSPDGMLTLINVCDAFAHYRRWFQNV